MSNLFIRAGDDSLMMWSFHYGYERNRLAELQRRRIEPRLVRQFAGDYSLVDGLYVVKTDWSTPTVPSWTATNLNGQNDAVIASLMVPGTMFGSVQPSLYRNIFVEDAPRTLFSLKIDVSGMQ